MKKNIFEQLDDEERAMQGEKTSLLMMAPVKPRKKGSAIDARVKY